MILMYHGIVRDLSRADRWCVGQAIPLPSFERQLSWLLRHFHVIPLYEYIERTLRKRTRAGNLIAITFDDGLDTAFRLLYPLLKEHQVPSTFFVSTSHLEQGPLLWFNVINALCFEEGYEEITVSGRTFPLRSSEERKRARHGLGRMAIESGNVRAFSEGLSASYPLPALTKAAYQGMTHEQLKRCVREGLVEIGAHSLSHPLLSQLNEKDHAKEVMECKDFLSGVTGKSVRYFAYPGGDYTRQTLDYIRRAGYEAAFCTNPKKLGYEAILEIERIGVYSPSMFKLCLKGFGIVPFLRRLGFSVG